LLPLARSTHDQKRATSCIFAVKSTGKGYRTFSKTMPFWNDLFIPASGDGSIGS
jgi:hypothetical protein